MTDRSIVEPTLGPLQRWFARVITDPEGVAAGVASADAAYLADRSSAARVIRPGARMSPVEQLGVYHHAYGARLLDCLLDDYPALAHALGSDFGALARSYIARFPSRSPSLNGYGQHMAQFCAEQPSAQAAFHAELARFEWAIVEVIHAHDGAPIALTSLAALSQAAWSRVALMPSSALRLLETQYPINAYYQAFREQAASALPGSHKTFTLIRRRGAQVLREPLTEHAGQLFASLLRAEAIGQALESAAESGMTAEQVSGCFERWIGSGCFVAITDVGGSAPAP